MRSSRPPNDPPLSLEEIERLDCAPAYRRAVELGYVSDYFTYRAALQSARFDATLRGETSRR